MKLRLKIVKRGNLGKNKKIRYNPYYAYRLKIETIILKKEQSAVAQPEFFRGEGHRKAKRHRRGFAGGPGAAAPRKLEKVSKILLKNQ